MVNIPVVLVPVSEEGEDRVDEEDEDEAEDEELLDTDLERGGGDADFGWDESVVNMVTMDSRAHGVGGHNSTSLHTWLCNSELMINTEVNQKLV